MKKIFPLLVLTSLIHINVTHAMTYIIGNDTIHSDNGRYYKINLADTFNIDTSIILIRYSSMANVSEKANLENAYHLTKIHEYVFGWTSYNYGENQAFIDLAGSLDQEALIDMVEYNTEVHYLCEEQIPSDHYFNNSLSNQWYLNNIQAPLAWALTTGNPEVKVGIIDCGFDWEHPDLGPGDDGYDNINLNQSQVPNQGEDAWNPWNDPTAHNPDDDDDNGYYNDWKGWGEMFDVNHYPSFYSGNDARNYSKDFVIQNGYGLEKWNHGTFIAGIIGAKTNNDIGIAGIAGGWQSQGSSLIFYKIGIHGSVTDAINYLVNELSYFKADIIEMAFTTDFSNAIDDAISYAYNDQGAFLIAAAGNHAPGGGFWQVAYPANNQYVYAVGATDLNDYHKPESNLGDGLDISAPGQDIYGLIPTDGLGCNDCYDYYNGNTSAASAIVAGTAALMLSINPDLSNQDIENILNETADKVHLNDPYEYDEENGWCWELGYGRLNAYKAVCKAWSLKEEDNYIDDDDTWTDDRTYFNSVLVTGYSTLTITSKVQFSPNAKLIIDEGCTVIIDGGTLTNINCCDLENKFWPGVEVWGNSWASQYNIPGYNFCLQGKLILRNGATIENAANAVDLCNPDEPDGTGGIIDANKAIFRNNSRSIHAMDYRNFNPYPPYAEMDYFGTFNDCSFILDENYLGDKTFYKHVDLDRVRGFKFYGCSFELNHQAENVSEWNLGIAAYNAGFHVLPTCTTQVVPCPLNDIDSCKFNGFQWAIGTYNNSIYPVQIMNAHFDDNVVGIFVSSTNYPVILENFFEVGFDEGNPGTCGFANGLGIDIHSSIGFAVENNSFRKNLQAPPGIYAGIRAYWCRTPYDMIYKNDFRGLSYGNYAEGTNRKNPLDDNDGIEYQCNQNFINIEDFRVTAVQSEDAMIRGTHGNRVTASGNRFSRATSPNNWHFWYGGRQIINWHYCEAPCVDEKPEKIYELKEEYFVENESPESNDCPDHYGGGGHINLSAGEKTEKELEFLLNQIDYNAVYNLYESLIDGGNTESELSDIQIAEPDEMWDLRTQLLGHSPHLSQDVLRAVSDRTDVFPDDVLLEILSANPDELNRDTLLSFLEQKEDPLPDYMIEILRQAVGGVTYKTILLDEMATYHAKQHSAAQDIIRSILHDTLFDVSDYRDWLDNLWSIEADKQIISSYLHEKDTTNAKTLLYLLPTLYELEGDELEDYGNYQLLIEMQIDMMASGKTIFDLDSLEIGLLDEIAIDGQTGSGNLARNILTYAFNYQYCDCLEFTDSTQLKRNGANSSNVFNLANYALKISTSPNPARTWVAINYELPLNETKGEIRITDIIGKVIHYFKVNSNIGQNVWDTRDVPPGLYYVRLTSSGLNRSVKLVIH